jgi:hypothetical protein
MDAKEYLTRIELQGKTARGKMELAAFFEGKRLSMKESILAHCYECQGYYQDGQRQTKAMPKA